MKEGEITKFLVSFSGQIEYATFPGGVFDDQLYIQYEMVWGPDWDPVSGLTSGTSQMSRSGKNPERVVFNMPMETVFSSTNVSGCEYFLIGVNFSPFALLITMNMSLSCDMLLLCPIMDTRATQTY